MSWLEDIERVYEYACPDGHIVGWEGAEKDRGPNPTCHCGKATEYQGFSPVVVSTVTKVAYEQNGRLAYRISSGKGEPTYMSRTRYEMNQTGKINEHYTADFKAAQKRGETV